MMARGGEHGVWRQAHWQLPSLGSISYLPLPSAPCSLLSALCPMLSALRPQVLLFFTIFTILSSFTA